MNVHTLGIDENSILRKNKIEMKEEFVRTGMIVKK